MQTTAESLNIEKRLAENENQDHWKACYRNKENQTFSGLAFDYSPNGASTLDGSPFLDVASATGSHCWFILIPCMLRDQNQVSLKNIRIPRSATNGFDFDIPAMNFRAIRLNRKPARRDWNARKRAPETARSSDAKSRSQPQHH